MSQAESASAASSASPEDDWASIRDPTERRKVQNRIAQRKFREKLRLQREESERSADDHRLASGAYRAPDAEDVDTGDESGLPWGSMSFRHVVVTGKAKEQSSRETSLYAAASRTGGSSRVGLHLANNYARGNPAWVLWRSNTLPFGQPHREQKPWTSAPA